MNVAIVGASGYTGLELIRILSNHPGIQITCLTSERYAGKPISAVYPSLGGAVEVQLEPLCAERVAEQADIIFTALPHKEAMAVVPYFYDHKKRIIDLSADFRISDSSVYQAWYQEHTASELLSKAVYGLPELNRAKIKKARIVANPGCYPTSIILPLLPLLREECINLSDIIADAKSGVSGAGRSLKLGSLFCEAAESLKAYAVLHHRHQPEIDEQLSVIAGRKISITFTPHLIPINRGMLSTIYVNLKRAMSAKTIASLLHKQYRNEPFVRILPEGTFPETGWVRGSNYCDIGFAVNGKRLILLSAIDNLTKGASGQAVQNLNIMLGMDESTALTQRPLYP